MTLTKNSSLFSKSAAPHKRCQSHKLLMRKYMDTNPHTSSFLCPELCLWVIQSDSDQVDTSTDVTRTLKDTHVHACSQTSLPEQEPDTREHLLHLPHTWPSNQCACVKNGAPFSATARLRRNRRRI